MAPSFKRKSNYKSDNFVASDDEDERPLKKGKTGGSDFKPSLRSQTDSNGDRYWEISRMRRVTVSNFKGKSMVNIREYYEKEGETLPGKKGISMTVEQYSTLVKLIPQIESVLSAKGEAVPRPDYDGTATVVTGGDEAEDGDGDEDEDEDEKKANIEATSDEEE